MFKVSVIIIAYNMAREVPRTVQSFLPPYQLGVGAGDVEIIVVENGSSSPIPPSVIAGWPANVRYHPIRDARPSPASALNVGAAISSAPIICPVIDGARMASPGLLRSALSALAMAPEGFVASVGFHLGRKRQQEAVLEGYNQSVEDGLLESIGWPQDGYRLFEICATAGSGKSAWFGPIAESNAPALSREMYEALGGFDERYNIPGGGLVNLDFFNRALEMASRPYFVALGEATFHQFHGGVTTSRNVGAPEADGESTWSKYVRQFAEIRGRPYSTPARRPVLFGEFPKQAARIGRDALDFVLSANG
jgi:glycosyltransferase involved in cell wall biosynthesis